MSRQIYAVCLKCFFSLVVLLSIAVPALAQSTAAINGLVQDTSDALIPNASVKLINTATGTESNSTTNKSGSFVLPNVMPGHYTLQIERGGFDTTQLTGITLNVGDNKSVVIRMKVGSTNETVTVDGSGLTLNTTDATVGTVIDRKFVENMPLNGRSFQDLISMTPGVVTQSPQTSSQSPGAVGDFSVNGQRTQSNYYTVDGVTANISSGNGGGVGEQATGGTLGASTALGTTQSLISVDALQEFRVQSSTYSAEYGRSPGGQFSLVTRSGTNRFHGTAFDYLRNNFFDANDWFNDHYGDPTPALRQNDFGGTLGGPVWIPRLYNGKDRTFFFVSYEGLRLTQPTAASIQYVPDLFMRQQAVPAIQGILNAYPLPNGIDYGTSTSPNLAQFIAPFSLPSSIDSTSVRLDQTFGPKLAIFFRFGDTPSSTGSRPYFARETTKINAQTYTLGATSQISRTTSDEFRLGYARSDSSQIAILDNFGGATPIDLATAMGASSTVNAAPAMYFYIPGIGSSDMAPGATANYGRQWNVVNTLSLLKGRHNLKFGIDYRRIASPIVPSDLEMFVEFLSPQSILNDLPDFPEILSFKGATPIFNETALFAQDEWHLTSRVNLSLGLRWEVNPPPTEEHGDNAYTLQGSVSDPASLAVAPKGTPLWKTTWYNFAPRLGMAWTANDHQGAETVIRAGGGIFFDTANEVASLGYSDLGFVAYQIPFGAQLPFTSAQLNVPITSAPPYTDTVVVAFPPHLQLPYTIEWNVSLQQELGKEQALTISYVGGNGRRLTGEQLLSLTNLNPNFGEVEYFAGGITSNYQSLQTQFQRTVARGLQALASYTWSHSLDFGSNSAALPLQRGNSDFDVRNNFQGGASWDLPSVHSASLEKMVLNGWGLDARVNARSAFPITLGGNNITNPTTGTTYPGGLNLVPNQPIYLHGAQYPGGKAINIAAFNLPPTGAAGNAPRNFVRGFGATQLNLAARRAFQLHDAFALQFRAEAFNILNHPNFGHVDSIYTDATFGQATQMLNSSLATMASQYQQGGPRSMQFSLKLLF